MLISDWSSDVCSSDLAPGRPSRALLTGEQFEVWPGYDPLDVRGDVVRFAAMLSSRRDNELRTVACDPFRFAAGREQALLSVLTRPIAESGVRLAERRVGKSVAGRLAI